MLRVECARQLGPFRLEVSLEAAPGETLVVVGENGSGKTTLLRLVAGLDRPDAGTITLNGESWFDAAAGLDVPAAERGIGFVTQDYALFPHLNARENVAFGLKVRRVPAADIHRRTGAMLDRLGISELAGRPPAELSGGQRQRVALARSLITGPRLLLLDEPLAAVDVPARRDVRLALRRVLADLAVPAIYVTHSPTEAMAFGDRIAVLEAGRVSQVGSRDELLRHPRSIYVAEFLGLNFFAGPVVARGADGLARLSAGGGEITIVDPGREGEVIAVVDPREIVLSLGRPEGSGLNTFAGAIAEIVPEPPSGERVRVLVESRPRLVAEITRRSAEGMGLAPGTPVHATFKATGVRLEPSPR